jgi:hypothetical protein
MSSIISTELYRHYQITVQEEVNNTFNYRIDNPNSNKSMVHRSTASFASALDAQNAAQAQVDILPSNSCRSLITAITGSDTISDEIINSLMVGLYVMEVAKYERPLQGGLEEQYEWE